LVLCRRLIVVSFCCLLGIDSGAVLISGGSISIAKANFEANVISQYSNPSFPNLRHNVFVADGATVDVASVTVDTPRSYFVYVEEEGAASTVRGLDV
jgi:hypothetical protein